MLRINLCYDYRVTITPEKIRDNPYQKDNVYQLTNVMRCNAKASKQNDVNAILSYVCNAKNAKKQTRYATHKTASSKQQKWYRSDIGVLEIESTSK